MSFQAIKQTDTLNNGRTKINSMFSELYAGLSGNPILLFTSQSGAVDDADISLGSTSFGTDSRTALQNMLDTAQSQPIIVIWDGKYSVSGFLKIYSNTHIIGMPGCGVILRDHSNTMVFRNANIKNPSEAVVDENIIIDSLIINGNGYNTGETGSDVFDTSNSGSATNGSAQTKRNPIIDFTGVKNLILRDIQLLGGRYWASVGCNLQNAVYENVYIDFGASSTRDPANYDGLHFKGGINNLRIINPTLLNCKDDNIAFNAHAQLDIYQEFIGPIKNVFVNNVYLDGRTMGIAIYSEASNSPIDNIHIKGIYGETESHFMRIINGETNNPEGNGVIGTIIVEDCHCEVKGSSSLQNFNALINVRANIDKLVLRNCTRTDFTKSSSYIRLSKEDTSKIKQLIVDGVQMETTGGNWEKPFLEVSEGQIDKCIINNYIHRELTSAIDAPVVLVNGGSIGNLCLGVIDTENVNQWVVVSSGTLTAIQSRHLGTYTVATVPTATLYAGCTIYVTDDDGGACIAYSDGANWKRVDDNTNIET